MFHLFFLLKMKRLLFTYYTHMCIIFKNSKLGWLLLSVGEIPNQLY